MVGAERLPFGLLVLFRHVVATNSLRGHASWHQCKGMEVVTPGSPSVVGDKVRSLYVVRNNVEHLCNSNLLLYYVNPNMYK